MTDTERNELVEKLAGRFESCRPDDIQLAEDEGERWIKRIEQIESLGYEIVKKEGPKQTSYLGASPQMINALGLPYKPEL